MLVQPRFRRLAAFASVLLASTSVTQTQAPARAEPLNLPPIRLPTTKEECLKMLDDLIMDMGTYMTVDEFAQLYQNMPFDLAIKRDCEAENYGAAYEQAVGMRPTERSVPKYEGSESNCFLTTACCDLIGLKDDCLELSVLRRYRDTVLPALPGGKAEVDLYYVIAPAILAGLSGGEGERRLRRLYFTHVLPCVALAWLGFGERTRRHYRDMLAQLCVFASKRRGAP